MGNSFSDRGRSAHDALSATNECSACGSASTGTPTRHHLSASDAAWNRCPQERGSGVRKRLTRARLSPFQSTIKHPSICRSPPRNPFRRPAVQERGFGGEKAAHKSASLPVPINHQTFLHLPMTAPQPIPTPGSTREGFGGEKAARKSASLPVPINHQTFPPSADHRPATHSDARQYKRGGSEERKRLARARLFPYQSAIKQPSICQ